MKKAESNGSIETNFFEGVSKEGFGNGRVMAVDWPSRPSAKTHAKPVEGVHLREELVPTYD
jgi:hypothetical protein